MNAHKQALCNFCNLVRVNGNSIDIYTDGPVKVAKVTAGNEQQVIAYDDYARLSSNDFTVSVRKTPAQRQALEAYEFALRQEDRYLGSVFVTPQGQRDAEARTAAAYAECKRLGLTHAHGL